MKTLNWRVDFGDKVVLVTEFYVDDIFGCLFVNNLDKKFFFCFDLNFLLKSKNVFCEMRNV